MAEYGEPATPSSPGTPAPMMPFGEERETLLEKEVRKKEERARSMAAVIELKYISRPRSTPGSLRARRQRTSVDHFELLKVIGRGAFGEVRLCRERASGSVFAMKTMRKAQLVEQGKVAHVWAERVAMAEAADGNPWVVQLHHAWCSAEHVYLVMDYLPGGDLMTLLMRYDTLSEEDTRFYSAEAVCAIEALHALGFAHRDIKPDNLLLDREGHLRLADLGLAKSVSTVSPPHACAPRRPEPDPRSHDAPSPRRRPIAVARTEPASTARPTLTLAIQLSARRPTSRRRCADRSGPTRSARRRCGPLPPSPSPPASRLPRTTSAPPPPPPSGGATRQPSCSIAYRLSKPCRHPPPLLVPRRIRCRW